MNVFPSILTGDWVFWARWNAALSYIDKPAWISFSCRDEKHINDGTLISECVSIFKNHPKVFAIGVNCTKPKYVTQIIQLLRSMKLDHKIIIYPHSGEVYNAQTKTWSGLSDPGHFFKMAQEWIDLGADILGGCCRIGPKHIQQLTGLVN